MGRSWYKKYNDFGKKSKVRREIRTNGPGLAWLWDCCLSAASEADRGGQLLLEDGTPFTVADLIDLSSLSRTEVERCITVLLRWGASSKGKWLSMDGDVYVIKNYSNRQINPATQRKRKQRQSSKDCDKRRTSPVTSPVTSHVNVTGKAEAEAEAKAEADPGSVPTEPLVGSDKPKPTRCPFKDLLELWNATAEGTNLPLKQKLSDKEKTKIKKQWVDKPDLEYWRTVFARVVASDFCRGGGSNGWKAGMTFCFQDHKASGTPIHERIVGGSYDGKKIKDDPTRDRYGKKYASAAVLERALGGDDE